MRIVYKASGGLDVHKRNVVACRMRVGADGKKVRETQTFGATTTGVLTLFDWLAEWPIEHVALGGRALVNTGNPSTMFWRDNSTWCW